MEPKPDITAQLSLFVLIFGIYGNTMECIKIKTAPRVYLVDTLLKKVK